MPQNLGWPVICLPVQDLAKSIAFYEKLDFTNVFGSPEMNYACMQQRNHEIHLHHGCIDAHMLNFRGGDVRAIVAEIKGRGIAPVKGHVDSDGEAVDVDGCTTACYFDPDGLEVMFDTHPDEAKGLAAGEPFCTAGALSKLKPDPLLLGNFTYCIDATYLKLSIEFYKQIGFYLTGDFTSQNWAVMTLEEKPEWGKTLHNGLHLSIFQGMLNGNLLNWRGGNVFKIAEVLESRGVEFRRGPFTDEGGSDNLFLNDPDGHELYFNTYPVERLYEDE